MQRRGEVTVASSATSGPSVITAPPPQPGLKDHPVKNGERVGEVRGQRGPKPNRVFWTWCDLCSHHPQQLWPPAQDQASQPSIAECEGDS